MAPTACVSPADVCTIKNDLNSRGLLGRVSKHGDELLQSGLTAKELVLDVLKKRAAEVDTDRCEPGEEDAFYVADMGEVYRQHMRWKMNLGRVKPFYGKFRQPLEMLCHKISLLTIWNSCQV
jgi:ornithine decarboxylase